MADKLPLLRRLAPRNLTDEVVERLAFEIRNGRLMPGARLPTEQKLMNGLGVSRTVVREAISALRSEGLVVTRQGSGAFVAADGSRVPFRIDADRSGSVADVLKVMELRLAIEVEAAALAAERANTQQVARIERALAEIDRAIGRGEGAVKEDFDFHRSIASVTGNSHFAQFLEFLGRYVIPRQSIRLSHGAPAEQRRYLELIQREHRRIAGAIKARDPMRARRAMRTHLSNSLERYRRLAQQLGVVAIPGDASRRQTNKEYRMERVLITGAAGDVGRRLRRLLKPVYPELRSSDIKIPTDLGTDESFVAADLGRMDEVERVVEGVEGIIHLGGYSIEGPWETILSSNIIGCYNLFEAARRKNVKRIVFASSNHAVGFYPRYHRIGADVTVRPDSRYGVSKAFGEALGALYADKHSLGVLCLRIGNVADQPIDQRRLSIWLKPEDLAQLVRIGLEHPDLHFEIFYGASFNERAWWDNSRAYAYGYRPTGRAEDFRDAALAAQAQLPADPIGDFYQGGTFCSDEFSGDPARIWRPADK